MDNSIAFPVQLQRRVAGCDLVILLYMWKIEEFRVQYWCLWRAKQFTDIGVGSIKSVEEAGGS